MQRTRKTTLRWTHHLYHVRPLFIPSPALISNHALCPVVHMFVSFQGWNELHFENITEFGLQEIRSMIFPLWEDGIENQIVTSTECIVKFRNQPWDTTGPNSLM